MGEYILNEVALDTLKPVFTPSPEPESSKTAALIQILDLLPHVEGGYFSQTDEDTKTIPSPYPLNPLSGEPASQAVPSRPGFDPAVRRLSTSIFYFLTHRSPLGRFHRNRSRIIHTLHRGRGRYVLLHPDGRVESFIVGHAVERGERLQWVVEGGVWKASYLLDTEENMAAGSAQEPDGLLISETVVPGFEYADHEFLSERRLGELVPESKAMSLGWLARKSENADEVTDSSEESDAPEVNSGETVEIGEAVELRVGKAEEEM